MEEISLLERDLGNTAKSLEASLKALSIYESLKLDNKFAVSFDQVAVNYIYNNDYRSAISYLKKAMNSYHSNPLNKIAIINNLGEAYRKINKLDSAKIYFNSSLQKNDLKDTDYLHLKGYSLGNLGMVYASENNLKVAESYLKEAIDIVQEFEDLYSLAIYKAELGVVYNKLEISILAEKYLTEALSIAQKVNLKEQIKDISNLLAQFYESQKKYTKAFIHQKRFQIYQDSLVNRENIKKIEQVKSAYEIDKRENEINLLNQINATQKKWVLSLALGFSILIFLLYLLFRNRKKIKNNNIQLSAQKEIISQREQEKALLLSELNHRVKNNLQMIASLLNLQSNQLTGHPAQEAIIIGKQRVEALSLVHQKLYQEGVDTRIHVKEYISELVLGLFHSYDTGFEPEMDISDVSLNIDAAIPLALIINEIIINALKYAYKGIKKPSLKIKIDIKNIHSLYITISDNGIGFEEASVHKSNSLGLKIINSLIIQLKGTIKKINNNGTTWEIKIQNR